MSEFSKINILHQQLTELSAYKNSALVIEANYSDFLNPNKLKFYSPSFAGKAIADIHALHPTLSIVFAGNRKLANEWVKSFFNAVLVHLNDVPHNKIMEVVENYGDRPEIRGGMFYDLRKFIISELPNEFMLETVIEKLPETPKNVITKVLKELEKEGVISKIGMGQKSVWVKNKI